MAESSLSLTYNQLAGEVGRFLGYGTGTANGDQAWSTKQQADIDSAVSSGIRQFYYPPPIAPGMPAYDWTFLKPVATLTLPSGANTLILPDDFGGPEGRVTVTQGTQAGFWALDWTGEGRIREMFSAVPSRTGRPLWVGLQPIKGTTSTEGQRFQLYLFPTADSDYTLQFAYYILPDFLSGTRPYTYGGMAHAETLKESCLACAEQSLDDAMSVHTQKFKERLEASISVDRRNRPQKVGYNGDRSDWMDRSFNRGDLYYDRVGGVTVNGVQYGLLLSLMLGAMAAFA